MTASGDLAIGPTVLSGAPTPDAAAGALAPGDRAGDYVVERRLGAGAMGEVYAGHHPLIGKRVAIKVIRAHLASSPEAAERLVREARAVNQVDHRNVVDVFAIGRLDDGRLYLVMDLVEGESLRARLGRGRLSADQALAVLEPIASALDAAHARGVVHRDLKPDNVMVSGPPSRPDVSVLDFGIAKLLALPTSASTDAASPSSAAPAPAPAPGTLTSQGTWLGTPAYMAPEQWSADGAGPASDRYALGIIAYELLAGTVPFVAASAPAMMEQHFRGEVAPLAGKPGVGVPEAVDDVLARALAKDPSRRFDTATELVEALRVALGTQVGPRRAAVAPSPPAGSRLPWLAGGAALAITGVGVWIVADGRSPSREAGTRPVPTAVARIEVLSTPGGARVVVAGKDVGPTPAQVPGGAGETITVALHKPGYVAATRSAVADATTPGVVSVTLEPVTQFEGTWAMSTGELRRFVRDGEAVVAYRTTSGTDPGTYYRRFEFVPIGDADVAFAAREDFVDERAPNDPSCHVPLQSQYQYDREADQLALKRERVALDFQGGHCVPMALEWGPTLPLTRVGGTAPESAWAESRAGGGATEIPTTPPPNRAAPRKGKVGKGIPTADRGTPAKASNRPNQVDQIDKSSNNSKGEVNPEAAKLPRPASVKASRQGIDAPASKGAPAQQQVPRL